MADFIIEDGSPYFWMSNSIWVRNTKDVPTGWVNTNPDPPGAFETPKAGQENYVWVKVGRHGVWEDTPVVLHLWAARGGPSFVPSALVSHTPDGTWDLAKWNAEIHDNHVVPIRYFDGVDYYETRILPKDDIPDDGIKWYLFTWEPLRVPPASTETGWHPCLLAWVEAAQDPNQSADVPGNDNFAQRNITVETIGKSKTLKRRVTLGNPKVSDQRLGINVWAEGEAAKDAEISFTFVSPKDALDRVAIPKVLPFQPRLPLRALRRRLPVDYGVRELRDAPAAWGIERVKDALQLKRRADVGLQAGVTVPRLPTETFEIEISITTKAEVGQTMQVHVSEFTSLGRVPGGVTFALTVV